MFSRIAFALAYRTLSRIAVDPADPEMIVVHRRGGALRMKRRCPHQGAFLETGYFRGSDLVCPWHGCKFPVG